MEAVHRNVRPIAETLGQGPAAKVSGSAAGWRGDAHADDDIVRHIPYLRRYARALTGSQEVGDQYVRICLEALVEEPDILKLGPFRRLHLYNLFQRTWTDVAERVFLDDVPHAGDARDPLSKLSSHRRQVLLLTAVEGFSLEEAAAILDITPEKAEGELAEARTELNDQAATTVLIIEDEPIIAFDLCDIVTDMGHKVVGTAATRAEAVSLARRKRPGIVLADIQLGDGSSGIDAVSDILRARDVPVVFVTAYPEKLLTGQTREPAYLVTKPFEPDVLRVTIYQALLSRKTPPFPSV